MDLVAKQREERKRRILDVARKLIAEKGYDGVTMRELADLSLVSVPTLYNLFGGKNELLFAAVESYFAELLGGPALSGAECRSNPSVLVCGVGIAPQESTPGPAGRLGNAGSRVG